MSFYSYRDPNTFQTLEQFNNAIQWAIDGSFTEEVSQQ